MRHRRAVTVAWGVAFVLWIAFVWGRSLMQGPASSVESGRVVAVVRPVFVAAGVTDFDLITFIVRKSAHFSEYAVLGFLGRGLFSRLQDERGLPAWVGALAVALVPVADETIQLFVPGRSGSPRDVLIDLCGAALGTLVFWAGRRLWRLVRARRSA